MTFSLSLGTSGTFQANPREVWMGHLLTSHRHGWGGGFWLRAGVYTSLGLLPDAIKHFLPKPSSAQPLVNQLPERAVFS